MTTATAQLYRLHSVVNRWPHGKCRYDNVRVDWFVDKRSYEPGFNYSTLLDRPVDDCYGGTSLVDELFTRDEAEKFAAYLQNTYDRDVTVTPVSTPINGDYCPISCVPVGGPEDFCMLSMAEGYDLSFDVWGHYRIESEQPISEPNDRRHAISRLRYLLRDYSRDELVALVDEAAQADPRRDIDGWEL